MIRKLIIIELIFRSLTSYFNALATFFYCGNNEKKFYSIISTLRYDYLFIGKHFCIPTVLSFQVLYDTNDY